jgi:hypothetical protein
VAFGRRLSVSLKQVTDDLEHEEVADMFRPSGGYELTVAQVKLIPTTYRVTDDA